MEKDLTFNWAPLENFPKFYFENFDGSRMDVRKEPVNSFEAFLV